MTEPDFSNPHTNYRFEDSQGRPFKTFREFLNFHFSPHPMMDWSLWFTQLSDAIIAWQDRPEPEPPEEPIQECRHPEKRIEWVVTSDSYFCTVCHSKVERQGAYWRTVT